MKGKPHQSFQRLTVEDAAAWDGDVRMARQAIAEPSTRSDAAEMARRLGRLGMLLAMDPSSVAEAVTVLGEALDAACLQPDRELEATVRLRLATALQYAGRHEEAEAAFLAAGRLIDAFGLESRRDFWAQHYGKCLVEMGRTAEARRHFLQALRLRSAKGNPELLDSTKKALAALRQVVGVDVA